MTADDTQATEAVQAAARAARAAAPSLARATDGAVDAALGAMARALTDAAPAVLSANAEDMRAAEDGGLPAGVRDRLRLDEGRLKAMAAQLEILAGVEPEPLTRKIRDLPGGLVLSERRRPVGVIGANFEARPNVVVDIASQLAKSRNAGVLRTGSAALRSAIALADHVIAPSLAQAGLDPAAVQLIRVPGQAAARALVREPKLIPLVILRGSGDSTRELAAEGAAHGVRTLAHADGGGVLYLHSSSERGLASALIASSLDRLGVCNRLNLLLVDQQLWDAWLPEITAQLSGLGITASLPPHDHPLGYEWALDAEREATVTIAPAASPADAAAIANEQTSGLAAGIAASDADAADEFLAAYAGTGAFWNATTRLLDGFKLLDVPETGINLDAVPGPRGPVTFRDLSLRQFVVTPAELPPGEMSPGDPDHGSPPCPHGEDSAEGAPPSPGGAITPLWLRPAVGRRPQPGRPPSSACLQSIAACRRSIAVVRRPPRLPPALASRPATTRRRLRARRPLIGAFAPGDHSLAPLRARRPLVGAFAHTVTTICPFCGKCDVRSCAKTRRGLAGGRNPLSLSRRPRARAPAWAGP